MGGDPMTLREATISVASSLDAAAVWYLAACSKVLEGNLLELSIGQLSFFAVWIVGLPITAYSEEESIYSIIKTVLSATMFLVGLAVVSLLWITRSQT
jgi:hypothetical protein